MLLIWLLSSIPQPFPLDRIPFQDKGVHFLEYGALGALLAHAIHGTWPGWRLRAAFAWAWPATVLWGLLDEIHQAFVPGRISDAGDLAADALGGLVGVLLYLWIRNRGRAAERARY